MQAEPQPKRKNDTQEGPYDAAFLLTLTIILLVVFGSFFLIFGLAYVEDLDTLRNVPNAIWNLVCGLPVENGVTLPLLWTISIVAFLAAGVLAGARWWISRGQEN